MKILESDNKYKFIMILLIVIFVVIVFSAIILSNIDFDKDTGTIATILNEGDLVVNYVDGDQISFYDSKEHTYGISITNTSASKIYYSIYFLDANIDDINVKIKDKNGNIISEFKENILDKKLINLYSIEGESTQRYTVVIKSNTKIKFKGTLKVINESMTTETFSDLILLNNNVGIQKSRIGSEIATKNEGLISSIDNKGTTYYFRGNIENNYVKINEFIFRIVRINGDSTVRLVLNDVLPNQYAYNTNTISEGGDVSSLTLLGSSTALNELNTWFDSNFSNYSEYFSVGDYCTDSSFVFELNGIKYSTTYERIMNDEAPDLYCSGNVYNGKVGLLNVDEVVFAGASGRIPNTSYYLYNKDIPGNYLTSSTYFVNTSNDVAMMNIMSNGAIGDGILIKTPSYLRPGGNISVNAKIKGSGTLNDPYIIVS